MYGILSTEGETGSKSICGICQSEADEGYHLTGRNNEEHKFLLNIFQDEPNFCVNDCCIDKFRVWCSEGGFDFNLGATPPDELVDSDNKAAVGDLSSPLFKEISPEHEYYFVKIKGILARNSDTLLGHLFDFTEWHITLDDCYQLDSNGDWVPVGITNHFVQNEVFLSTDDIIDIKKAHESDIQGEILMKPWKQRRSDEDAQTRKDLDAIRRSKLPLDEDQCKICNESLSKHGFAEQEKCQKRYSLGDF